MHYVSDIFETITLVLAERVIAILTYDLVADQSIVAITFDKLRKITHQVFYSTNCPDKDFMSVT